MRRALLLLAFALAACDEPAPPTPVTSAAPPASSATPAPPAPPTAASSTDGAAPLKILDEDAFVKLHELKDEAAPTPRGEAISLEGDTLYLSLPAQGEAPLPAVVVIHEWWGLNDHVRHWADRLAEAGYAALAVDLYGGEVAKEPQEAMKLMKAVDAEKARTRLLAAHTFLQEDDRVKASKTGSIGWCFGGKWSLELALATPELDAAVVYYGHVETDPERLAKLEAPLLAFFGNQDEGIPPKQVDRFAFGLEQAGRKDAKVLRYDAKHAFANPSSGRYDADAAEKAWSEVQTFLAAHLR